MKPVARWLVALGAVAVAASCATTSGETEAESSEGTAAAANAEGPSVEEAVRRQAEQWRREHPDRAAEKAVDVMTDGSEPIERRRRAARILVSEYEARGLQEGLERVETSARSEIVEAAGDEALKVLRAGDVSAKRTEGGGREIPEKLRRAAYAADAAYFLIPHAEGRLAEKLRGALAGWLARDWTLRTTLGLQSNVDRLERAAPEGWRHAFEHLKETDEPFRYVSNLRDIATDEQRERIAAILASRAEKAHPDLSKSLIAAVANTDHPAVVPYLERAVRDPDSPPILVDQAMEALKNIQGDESAELFIDLVSTTETGEHANKLRWAAVNDLIKVLGPPGVVRAAEALPTDPAVYAEYTERVASKTFREDAEWFAHFSAGEIFGSDEPAEPDVLIRLLESDRWPARLVGLLLVERVAACADDSESCDLDIGESIRRDGALEGSWPQLRRRVSNLESSGRELPGWEGGEAETVGDLARRVSGVIESL